MLQAATGPVGPVLTVQRAAVDRVGEQSEGYDAYIIGSDSERFLKETRAAVRDGALSLVAIQRCWTRATPLWASVTATSSPGTNGASTSGAITNRSLFRPSTATQYSM